MYTAAVPCGKAECDHNAEYKIAAPWSFGRFSELKSYGLTCSEHTESAFLEALQRGQRHPASPEEEVGEIGIYGYQPGKRDREMERLCDLEKRFIS